MPDFICLSLRPYLVSCAQVCHIPVRSFYAFYPFFCVPYMPYAHLYSVAVR